MAPESEGADDPSEIRNVLGFAARVDFTYWPTHDTFEIHWHTDEQGETPANVLMSARVDPDAEGGA